MKKITLLGCFMAAAYLSNAQSPWLLTGNSLSGGEFLGTTSSDPLIFKTDNNTVMEIDVGGNVGIGITPGAKLTVISGTGVATPGHSEGCTSPPETWASYGIYSSIESGTPYNRAVTGYIEANEAQNIGGLFRVFGNNSDILPCQGLNNMGSFSGAYGNGQDEFIQINVGAVGYAEGNSAMNVGGYFATLSECTSTNIGVRAEAKGGVGRIGIYATTGVNEDLPEDCELEPVEGYPSYLSNFAAFFEGNTFTTGTPFVMSDERLKTNKQRIESASELLSKIKTYTYEYKANKNIPVSKGMQRGVMAQEVAEHMPNAVVRLKTPETKDLKTGATRVSQEIYAVNYLEFIPLLISAFNEKSKAADELEEQVARQSSTIDELLNRLTALERKLDQICEQGCAGLQQRSSATPSLLNESLKFYPNPGSNRVTIDLNNLDISGEYYVTVYSSNGQMLFSKRLTNTSSLSEQLETGSWSAGAYTVSLSDKSKIISSGTLMITK